MSKKDFDLIAKALHASKAWGSHTLERGTMLEVIEDLADALATTNLRFDRERFVKACKNQEWVS